MSEESSFLNPVKAIRAAGIQDGMHVADFGAGSGFFTRAAAREVGPRGVVWAVDTHKDILTRIKNLAVAEGLHNVEILRATLEAKGGTALPAAKFDVVIAANILFSSENKEAVVAEMARVLHRGGRALVIDWSDSHGGLGPHPDHVCTFEDAQKLFTAAGFQYESDIPAGEFHWGCILRKKS